MLFIQSVAYSSRVSSELTQQLNDLLFSRCKKYGYNFIDNGAVWKKDLWTDGIHLIDSGKAKIANNLISCFFIF